MMISIRETVSIKDIRKTSNEIRKRLESILVDEFMVDTSKLNIRATNQQEKIHLYTKSPEYHLYTLIYHEGDEMIEAKQHLLSSMSGSQKIIDVGCSSGMSGLLFAEFGHEVTLYDFDGIALEIVQRYIDKNDLSDRARVMAYTTDLVEDFDWAIAFDTIEHSGNHLGFLRWMEDLSDQIAISYPLSIPRFPPFVPSRLDEWVDDERIQQVIFQNFWIDYNVRKNGRRVLVYRKPVDKAREL